MTALANSTLYPSLPATASAANSGTVIVNPTGSPIAAAESASTQAGVAVTINEYPNASDATGTLLPASVTISTNPLDGTTSVNASNGAITYTPAAGFTGTDTFQYTISDTTGAVSAPATVTVTVTAIPIGNPIAANLSEAADENTALTFNVAGFATDSTATIVPTSVVITQVPADGTATVDPVTGDITYVPATGYVGTDTLQYTVGDSLSAVSPAATVTFTVASSGPTGPTGPTNPTGPTGPTTTGPAGGCHHRRAADHRRRTDHHQRAD